MSKKYTYHRSHTWVTNEGAKHTFITQLYQIGIYGIIGSDPATQGTYEPKDIVKIEKAQKKALEKGDIKELEFGRQITVTKDEDGFWTEVKK